MYVCVRMHLLWLKFFAWSGCSRPCTVYVSSTRWKCIDGEAECKVDWGRRRQKMWSDIEKYALAGASWSTWSISRFLTTLSCMLFLYFNLLYLLQTVQCNPMPPMHIFFHFQRSWSTEIQWIWKCWIIFSIVNPIGSINYIGVFNLYFTIHVFLSLEYLGSTWVESTWLSLSYLFLPLPNNM